MRSSVTVLSMAVLWMAICDLSGARIGETLEQVLKRYGRCLRTVTTDNGMSYKLFSKSGFNILVHFYEGKVDEISYGKDTDIFDGSQIMIPAYRISADSSLPYNLPKAPYSVQVITIFHNGFSTESKVLGLTPLL